MFHLFHVGDGSGDADELGGLVVLEASAAPLAKVQHKVRIQLLKKFGRIIAYSFTPVTQRMFSMLVAYHSGTFPHQILACRHMTAAMEPPPPPFPPSSPLLPSRFPHSGIVGCTSGCFLYLLPPLPPPFLPSSLPLGLVCGTSRPRNPAGTGSENLQYKCRL